MHTSLTKQQNTANVKTISITEWMAKIDPDHASLLRSEDNSKRIRLKTLSQTIGLSYDQAENITLNDIINHTNKFLKLAKSQGNKKYAFRLLPLQPNLPKLRITDQSLKNCLRWFYEQDINLNKYRIELIPQGEHSIYSSILLINERGMWGQISKSKMWQLSLGLTKRLPITFTYDFKKWSFSQKNKQIEHILSSVLKQLQVKDIKKQEKLQKNLKAEFTKEGHLKGYFEFVVRHQNDISFIDYNRILYKIFKLFRPGLNEVKTKYIHGVGANPGTAIGRVKIVKNPHSTKIHKQEILVCHMLTIEFIPLIKKAAAIISEQGGLLSHSTIICRELKKPYIINVPNATKKLKNKDKIEVNADEGIVKMLP